jgi:hypothetical protein
LANEISKWLSLYEAGMARSSTEIPRLSWKQSTEMLFGAFLNDHWYYQWRSGKEMRFRALDGRFGTHVGRRDVRAVVSTGVKGCLLHGPYVSLEAGDYRITLRGDGSKISSAYVEVAMDKGKRVLAKAALQIPDAPLTGILASIDLAVPEKCKDLEVRVWVESSSNFSVSHVEIMPLEPSVAEDIVQRTLPVASTG